MWHLDEGMTLEEARSRAMGYEITQKQTPRKDYKEKRGELNLTFGRNRKGGKPLISLQA